MRVDSNLQLLFTEMAGHFSLSAFVNCNRVSQSLTTTLSMLTVDKGPRVETFCHFIGQKLQDYS